MKNKIPSLTVSDISKLRVVDVEHDDPSVYNVVVEWDKAPGWQIELAVKVVSSHYSHIHALIEDVQVESAAWVDIDETIYVAEFDIRIRHALEHFLAEDREFVTRVEPIETQRYEAYRDRVAEMQGEEDGEARKWGR